MHVVCAGDCGVDRYVPLGLDRPGGITLNVAANGRAVFAPSDRIDVITAVGTDAESRLVRQALAAFELGGHVVELPGATSVQYIDLDPSGEKRFLRYEAGVLAGWRLDDAGRALVAVADVLVAPVFAQVHGFFESLMAAPCPGLRAVDFLDLSDVDDPLGFVERHVGRIDVGFFGLQGETLSLVDDLERLAQRHGRLFVVTLGAGGSLALGGAGRLACPAVAVPSVVDTTGAGDSFAAGFLAEYSRSRDAARSLQAGADRAARTIQSVGAFDWP